MIYLGILIGIALSSLWRAALKLIFINKGAPQIEEKDPVIQVGPFLHKKSKGKKKPVSHTDSEVYEREMRNAGKML